MSRQTSTGCLRSVGAQKPSYVCAKPDLLEIVARAHHIQKKTCFCSSPWHPRRWARRAGRRERVQARREHLLCKVDEAAAAEQRRFKFRAVSIHSPSIMPHHSARNSTDEQLFRHCTDLPMSDLTSVAFCRVIAVTSSGERGSGSTSSASVMTSSSYLSISILRKLSMMCERRR